MTGERYWHQVEPPGLDALPVAADLLRKNRPCLDMVEDHLILRLPLPFRKKQRMVLKPITLLYTKDRLVSIQEGDPLPARDFESMRGLPLLEGFLEESLDLYFQVLDDLGSRLQQLERCILAAPSHSQLRQAHQIRKDLLHLRRSLFPIRDAAGNLLCRRDCAPLHEFLTRLNGGCHEILELIDVYRQSGSGLTRLYVASMSSRRSQVVKFLTLVIALFAPLSFLVAVYGMNFRHMPELDWKQGYPLCGAALLGLAASQARYLKSRGWL